MITYRFGKFYYFDSRDSNNQLLSSDNLIQDVLLYFLQGEITFDMTPFMCCDDSHDCVFRVDKRDSYTNETTKQ